MKEFELIEILKREFGRDELSDDAYVQKEGEEFAVYTTDALCSGVHYRPSWQTLVKELYYFLGWKLIAVSVSDLYATGAEPLIALLNFGFKESPDEEKVKQFVRGIKDASAFFRLKICGGDTVSSEGEFFSAFLKGKTKSPMLRRNAEPGELVFVSGYLGDAAAGLKILESQDSLLTKSFWKLVMRFLKPVPDHPAPLLEAGVRCASDVSDGLIKTAELIAEESGVSLKLYSEKIPISPELLSFSKEPLKYCLFGGEDYVLLFTAPEDKAKFLEDLGYHRIGVVDEGKGVFLDGKRVGGGYEHFGGQN